MSTDLRLDDAFQLTAQSNGDAELIAGDDCFMQTLRVEAASAEGDLWYDPDWGWSLLTFSGRAQDELTALELEQQVRVKLQAHAEIDVESITVTPVWDGDSITVGVQFRLLNEETLRRLNVPIGRTEIEVIPLVE